MGIQSGDAYAFRLGYELALKDSKNRFENVLATSGTISPKLRDCLEWHTESIARALAETQAELQEYRDRRK